MNKKVLFVDIDNTFVNFNTTFKFIYASIKLNYFKKVFFLFIKSFLFKILYKLNIYDSVILAYLLLKNKSQYDLEKEANNFVNQIIEREYINFECLKIINQKRMDNYEIILLSYSLDIIAKNLTRKYNFNNYYSNKLLFENSICLGKISSNFKKINIIKKYLNEKYTIDIITDNIEDYECTLNANKSYIIINKNNKRFWYKNKKRNYELIL